MVSGFIRPLQGEMLGGERTHKVEWIYPNKGTYEEDWAEEFDVAVVFCMFDAVTQLYGAIDAR